MPSGSWAQDCSLEFEDNGNFLKVVDGQQTVELCSIISSKGTLKLSDSTKITGSVSLHYLISDILTHGKMEDVVRQILQIALSLMSLYKASFEITKEHFKFIKRI